jgi:drug/metabolite transporter (DMT)-like permease
MNQRSKGINAALISALFLGMAPVFGRQAILLGLSPMAVVAFRTLAAALLLLAIMALFFRKFLYIYPAGFLGCLLAGLVNGVGSLFYYSALGRIDASVGQLIYSLYPLFLVLWLSLDRQSPSRLTLVRIGLSLPAVFLLTQSGHQHIDLIGIGEMLIASALYALHLPINQRVLYEMPAPTVTLYTLLSMSTVVVPVFLFSNAALPLTLDHAAWGPLIGLTMVTFFSRITLFLGVKHLGGMQTALLGLSELLVTVLSSYLILHERLSLMQWVGAILLMFSLLMVGLEKAHPRQIHQGGWLRWLNPPSVPSISINDPDHEIKI